MIYLLSTTATDISNVKTHSLRIEIHQSKFQSNPAKASAASFSIRECVKSSLYTTSNVEYTFC